jgi:hypothetical protein
MTACGVSYPSSSDLGARVTRVTSSLDAALWADRWSPRRPLATDDLTQGLPVIVRPRPARVLDPIDPELAARIQGRPLDRLK